ncbi:MAG: peptide deformylase [Bacteroidota bacterium]|nr:peptide deformylase [Bacteroidota bacterium]
MILPIIGYGDPVLRKKAEEINKDYPDLYKFISDMFDTMDYASGVGLAAPQVGRSIRLFVVDTTPFSQNKELSKQEQQDLDGFREVFINPIITQEEGGIWAFNEGCLSIPGIHQDVMRKDTVHIEYLDAQFQKQKKTFEGLKARVIQHEYDHIEGILFIDRISSFQKKVIDKKLKNIMEGRVNADYRMKFFNKKK